MAWWLSLSLLCSIYEIMMFCWSGTLGGWFVRGYVDDCRLCTDLLDLYLWWDTEKLWMETTYDGACSFGTLIIINFDSLSIHDILWTCTWKYSLLAGMMSWICFSYYFCVVVFIIIMMVCCWSWTPAIISRTRISRWLSITQRSFRSICDGSGQALVCEQELKILKWLWYHILPTNRDPQPFRNLFALVWWISDLCNLNLHGCACMGVVEDLTTRS
jgi:hypothetical protein